MWQHLKTWNVTKLKNLKCGTTQKLKTWLNSKTQNVTKLKYLNVTKIKIKLKMWQKSKILNVTKPKKLKCDNTQKLKNLQNSTTQIKQQEKKCGKTEEKTIFDKPYYVES